MSRVYKQLLAPATVSIARELDPNTRESRGIVSRLYLPANSILFRNVEDFDYYIILNRRLYTFSSWGLTYRSLSEAESRELDRQNYPRTQLAGNGAAGQGGQAAGQGDPAVGALAGQLAGLGLGSGPGPGPQTTGGRRKKSKGRKSTKRKSKSRKSTKRKSRGKKRSTRKSR